jgi:DNA polymerase-3 subunit delta'
MWPVVGHEAALSRLKRSLEKGNLGHAYLISGPAHAGKMTLALALARALNCHSAEVPCGECSQCRRIDAFSHPDVQVVALGSASSDDDGRLRTEISIKQVRDDIQHWANLPPFEGGYRVFIIGGAEMLSPEAANCLLKTLEEPQPRVLFMLLTEEPGRLPETVISRCQRIDLRQVAAQKIEAALLEKGVLSEKARLLSRLCRGCPGWAMEAAADETLLVRRAERVEHIFEVIAGDLETRFNFAAELAVLFNQKRAEAQEALDEWQDLWRDMLLIRAGLIDEVINKDYASRLQSLAGRFNINEIRAAIGAADLAGRQLRQNGSPRLVLEVLMLDLPAAGATKAEF